MSCSNHQSVYKRLNTIFLSILAGIIFSGCQQLGYYYHVSSGHLSLMQSREPIQEVIETSDITDGERAQLELALRMRKFATKNLSLPDNDSYRCLARIDRPYVVWIVLAAPEFSLQPKTWHFPFTGSVVYRSYYEREKAKEYADGLRKKGYDVCVLGADAYSTLGWFDDPLPSTVLSFPEPELAGLIFHELAHQQIYVPSDSAFNESFAMTVQNEGVRRWMKENGKHHQLKLYEKRVAVRNQCGHAIEHCRQRLSNLYQKDICQNQMRRQKREIIQTAQQQLEDILTSHIGSRSGDIELNNASIIASQTYSEYVPAFEALLNDANGNMSMFYEKAEDLAEMSSEKRHATLKNLGERNRK